MGVSLECLEIPNATVDANYATENGAVDRLNIDERKSNTVMISRAQSRKQVNLIFFHASIMATIMVFYHHSDYPFVFPIYLLYHLTDHFCKCFARIK